MGLPGYMLAMALIIAQVTTAYGFSLQADCPQLRCAKGCEVDYSGRCPKCVCPKTCKDIQCTKDEHCVLKNVTCADGPCFPEPHCIPNNGSTKTCSMHIIDCPEFCQKSFLPNGCPQCACVPPPSCSVVRCPEDMVCVMKEVKDCGKPKCFPQPDCVPRDGKTTTKVRTTTKTTSKPKKQCPMIKCLPNCVREMQSDGCEICSCRPTCKNFTCAANHQCVLKVDKCKKAPCFRQPTCVPIKESMTTAKICPLALCLPHCVLQRGPDGCHRCHCPTTCETVRCSDGYECHMVNVTCATPPCFPQPRCVQIKITTPKICPMFKCWPTCSPGKGPDGCPICDCPKTCKNVKCSAGEECQLVNVTCVKAPCLLLPTCVPKNITTPKICPMLRCWPTCSPGKGPDGCPICDCPKTCKNVKCSAGEECQLVNVTCVKAPCFPLPTCVQKKITTPKICPLLKCLPTCFPGKGPDGCPRCDCPPTCKNFKCPVGQECQLVNMTCVKAPCFPLPKCVQKKTTTTKPCPEVKCSRPCELDILSGRCPICACPPSCKNKTCSSGSRCQLIDVECFRPPCFPLAKCVPIKNATTRRTNPCPRIGCSSPCVPGIGPDGCPSCECPPTCKTKKCSAGYECQLVDVNCDRPPCFPQPQCVPIKTTTTKPCPEVKCSRPCELDILAGRCPICACPPSCKNKTCFSGFHCQLIDVQCFRAPCFPPARCVPIKNATTPRTNPCPRIACSSPCVPGIGPDGCWSCECPPTCETVKCSAGYECQLVNVTCKRAPCFPQPQCVPIKTTPSSVVCPFVDCLPDCVTVDGPDGCPKCSCPPACILDCIIGYECVLVNVKCDRDPCFPVPRCVPIKTMTTKPIRPCPRIGCLPNCVTVTGPDGCPKCDCPKTCKGFNCSAGNKCALLQVPCKRSTCFPQPTCVPVKAKTTTKPCPIFKCSRPCEPDIVKDGCPTCACPPTCKGIKCRAGHECALQNVTCIRAPCFPQPTCVPKNVATTIKPCPEFKCSRPCEPGIVIDGCPTCVCPPTCKTVKCSAGHHCELVNVTCARAPCFPQPTCVAIRTTPAPVICPRVTCSSRCTLVVGSNGCGTCKCSPVCNLFCIIGYECVLVNVTCKQRQCVPQPKCVPIKRTTQKTTPRTTIKPCPKIRCLPICLKIDSNGCPKCLCPPTCQTVKCAVGYECVLTDVPCRDAVLCSPQPTCVQKKTPTTPSQVICPAVKCLPDCVLITQPNGCPACSCPPTCEAVDCIPGYECVLVNVTCDQDQDPCFPRPTCIQTPTTVTKPKLCPRVQACPNDCMWEYSYDGCPRCSCPLTCETVECASGYDCQMIDVNCEKQPCSRQPRCIQSKGRCPKRPVCGIACPFGLKVDKNGCQLCECRQEPQ